MPYIGLLARHLGETQCAYYVELVAGFGDL